MCFPNFPLIIPNNKYYCITEIIKKFIHINTIQIYKHSKESIKTYLYSFAYVLGKSSHEFHQCLYSVTILLHYTSQILSLCQ